MTVRRLLVATSVAFGMLASAPATAGQAYSLDGRRTTTKQWKATLTDTPVPLYVASNEDPLMPSLADCTAGSCDVHQLRLTLPRGTTWGRLTAKVTAQRGLETVLVLYDAEGAVVGSRDGLMAGEFSPGEDDPTSYTMELSLNWLTKGTYTLALHNRAGAGEASASVEWVAKRPDRKTNR